MDNLREHDAGFENWCHMCYRQAEYASKKGQIACYVRNYDQLLVTHRVHDIDKGDYYFKGDANKSYDGYVVQKQIYGTVVFYTNSVAKLIEKNVKWDTKTAIVKNKKYQA